ncbi:fibrillin-3 isoform X2 [Nematostella vectensis]|nr:fibrillin-3 isoform X2 [Nematostella vectensis]
MRREKAYVIDDKWHLEYVKVGDGGIWSKIDYGDWIDSTGHRMKVSSCEPQPGTKKKNGYCEDLNECNENPSICGVDGKCYNLPGTYECLCKPGFEKRDGVCKDINECAQPNHGCQDKCVNTVGSYRCECNLGFKPLTAGSKRCKNINECQENRPCVSPAVCMDTVGSYYCKCPDGYEADGPHRCKDVNECMTFHECDYQTSECVNQPVGSYTCKCRQGFKPSLKSPRLVCEDVNECQEWNLNICDQAVSECENTFGGFRCKCKSGYHQGASAKDCIPIKCSPLVTPIGGQVKPDRCQMANANAFGNTCTYSCNNGYKLADSGAHTVTCGARGVWEGTQPQCVRKQCPKLTAIPNAKFYPDFCGTKGASYTSICNYICDQGYEMSGNPRRTCQADETWSGVAPTCTKYVPKPWISCPFDIIVDLKTGAKTADVSSLWKLPRSNIQGMTTSPTYATANYAYPVGQTKITFSVSNSAGSASCSIDVIVNDQENPKITCPDDIYETVTSSSAVVTWPKPVYSDNVGVVKVTPTHNSGDKFTLGTTRVYYQVDDAAGNNARCSFTVNIKRKGCPTLIPPHRGTATCQSFNNVHYCQVTCPSGAQIYKNPSQYNYWTCSTGTWQPGNPVPECVDATEVSNVTVCTNGRVSMAIKDYFGAKNYCADCPTGTKSSGGDCVLCGPGEYQDEQGRNTCKTCAKGTSSLVGARNCTNVCPTGKSSSNGLEPCRSCPFDTYQNKAQSTSCIPCGNGLTTLGKGMTQPSDCGAKPAIKPISPVRQTVDEGNTVTMSCFATGTPFPDDLKFTFKSNIPASHLGKMTQTDITDGSGAVIGKKLTITGALKENSGLYECTGSNSWGNAIAVASLTVEISGSGVAVGDEGQDGEWLFE